MSRAISHFLSNSLRAIHKLPAGQNEFDYLFQRVSSQLRSWEKVPKQQIPVENTASHSSRILYRNHEQPDFLIEMINLKQFIIDAGSKRHATILALFDLSRRQVLVVTNQEKSRDYDRKTAIQTITPALQHRLQRDYKIGF